MGNNSQLAKPLKTKSLELRRTPIQLRAKIRTQNILDATVILLDRVGFDDLTTILIAKELGISVGSLYHYFPNKQTILREVANRWLQAWDVVLAEARQLPVDTMSQYDVVERLTDYFAGLYREQKGMLPLAQAMYCIPELRDLDEQHDQRVINCLSGLFKQIGIKGNRTELNKIARSYLEISHAMLLIAAKQSKANEPRYLAELNDLCGALLQRYS